MSLNAMSTVWMESKAGGTLLLLELALADEAMDSGWCLPCIESLARKTRTSERTVIGLLQTLEAMGELFTNHTGGPRGTNMYLLLLVTRGKFPNPDLEDDHDTGGAL